MLFSVALVLGAFWRRWWGAERPSWAFPGYRITQGVVGIAMVFGLALLAGHSWWIAGIRGALAIAFMSSVAMAIPHVWDAWAWIENNIGTPKLGRWFAGHTTYAEATCGAVVFLFAVAC